MSLHFDENVCLVCLKNGEGLSIQDPNLAEKYFFTTQINITENDTLPKTICEKCVARLKVAYDFRQLALTSHTQLVSFITKMTGEFKKVSKCLPNENFTELDDDELKILIEEGFDPSNGNTFTTKHFDNDTNEESTLEFDLTVQKSEAEYLNEDLFDDLKTYEDENFDEDNDPFSDIAFESTNKLIKSAEPIRKTRVETAELPPSSNLTTIDFDDDQDKNVTEVHSSKMITRKRNQRLNNITTSKSEDSDYEIESKKVKRSYKKSKKSVKDDGYEFIRFGCTKCNINFSSKQNLNRHLATHDGSKPFQCNYCGKAFTQNGSLKKHILIHTGERPHKCEICKRGFTQSTTLSRHMRRHTGEKPYECSQCDKRFRQKHMLKAHYDRIHQNETPTRQYVCPICNRGFASKFTADEHRNRHTDNNTGSFKCLQCAKIFSTKISLDIHNKTHLKNDDNLSLKCETCGNCFATRTLLADHIQNNQCSKAAEKFHCSICSKTFLIKSHFVQHMQNHNENHSKHDMDIHREKEHNAASFNLYQCGQCELLFENVEDLNNHNHDTVEEESCSSCPKKFSSKKLMESHVLLEHILDSVI